MMDFLYKYRRMIVIILAGILIGLGVLQLTTDVRLDANVMKTAEYVTFFGALYLLLILPKNYNRKKSEETINETGVEEADKIEQENQSVDK